MKVNRTTVSFISGLIFNVAGFFVGSNILIQATTKLVSPETEYKAYLLWSISGLLFAWLGNIIGVLIISPQNIKKTLVGSVIGLTIGIILSFIPLFYLGGIVTIFFGTLIGRYKKS